MSKQAQAKKSQNYVSNPTLPTCGNCQNFRSDRQLPDWMAEANKNYAVPRFTVKEDGTEKNLRCGIGGFAVKKMGSCRLFATPTEVA